MIRDKVTESEPYFILRAQDMIAPEIMEQWALRNLEERGCEKTSRAALNLACKMREWQSKNDHF